MGRYRAKNVALLSAVMWDSSNVLELQEFAAASGHSVQLNGETAIVSDGAGSFWYVRRGQALIRTERGILCVMGQKRFLELYEVIP